MSHKLEVLDFDVIWKRGARKRIKTIVVLHISTGISLFLDSYSATRFYILDIVRNHLQSKTEREEK